MEKGASIVIDLTTTLTPAAEVANPMSHSSTAEALPCLSPLGAQLTPRNPELRSDERLRLTRNTMSRGSRSLSLVEADLRPCSATDHSAAPLPPTIDQVHARELEERLRDQENDERATRKNEARVERTQEVRIPLIHKHIEDQDLPAGEGPEQFERLTLLLCLAMKEGFPEWINGCTGNGQDPHHSPHKFAEHNMTDNGKIDFFRGERDDDLMNCHWVERFGNRLQRVMDMIP